MQSTEGKTLFNKLILELGEINENLLQVLKKQKKDSLFELLDKRTKVSDQIQELSQKMTLKLGDFDPDFQKKASQVLSQDEELLIYLEIEIRKLQGRFERKQFQMRNQ